jgi:transcriptional regulator with XRE-family HTH domain
MLAVMAKRPDGRAVGLRIQEARERKNMKKAQLAKALGVHWPQVDSWEKGVFPRDYIEAIAKELHVSSDELLGSEPESNVTTLEREVVSQIVLDVIEQEKIPEPYASRLMNAQWKAHAAQLGMPLTPGLVRSTYDQMRIAGSAAGTGQAATKPAREGAKPLKLPTAKS